MIYALEFINEDDNIEIIHYDSVTKIVDEPNISIRQNPNYKEPDSNEVFFSIAGDAEETDGVPSCWYAKIATITSEEEIYAYKALADDDIAELFEKLIKEYEIAKSTE